MKKNHTQKKKYDSVASRFILIFLLCERRRKQRNHKPALNKRKVKFYSNGIIVLSLKNFHPLPEAFQDPFRSLPSFRTFLPFQFGKETNKMCFFYYYSDGYAFGVQKSKHSVYIFEYAVIGVIFSHQAFRIFLAQNLFWHFSSLNRDLRNCFDIFLR